MAIGPSPVGTGIYRGQTFGRIRPIHTTAVIFGFGGNALIATSFYVVQRTSRARLASETLPWLVAGGYNFIRSIGCDWLSLWHHPIQRICRARVVRGSDLADHMGGVSVSFTLKTLARRAEPHIYVANWYYLGFIVVIAMLQLVTSGDPDFIF